MKRRWEGPFAVITVLLLTVSMVAMPVIAAEPTISDGPQRSIDATTEYGQVGNYDVGSQSHNGPDKNNNGPKNDGAGSGTGANGPPGQGDAVGEDLTVTVPTIDANTSIEAVVTGVEALEGVRPETNASLAALNDTFTAVNATFQTYRGPNYIDAESGYEHLATAQRSLRELNDSRAVNRSSAQLADGSALSAYLQVAGAITVFENEKDAFERPGQRKKARKSLENAINSLDRADDALAREPPQRAPPGTSVDDRITARKNAITHHRSAWRHANRALDTIENAVEPELTVQHGQAFERNGTVTVPLEARVSDVRPYHYENATVRGPNGTVVADSISFVGDFSPGGTASGMTRLELESVPTDLTVTVAATSETDPDRSVTETVNISVDEEDVLWDRPDSYETITASDEDTGVEVSVSGQGLVRTDVSVEDVTPDQDAPFRAGPMVRIENETAFDTATVTFQISEQVREQARNGRNLSLYTWDPSSAEPWTQVETDVDLDAGTATATVGHFSFFSLFWVENWEDETSDTIILEEDPSDGGGNTSIQKADFVFVMDESGSMSGTPISYSRQSAKRFVGALVDDERAGLVGYDGGASIYQGLTRNHDAVNGSLSALYANGGTDTEEGLRTGLRHIRNNGWDNRSHIMILLSDGNSNSGSYPRQAARDAADAGVEISTIGLGSGIDENELRDIAAITGGDFYHVQSPSDLPETFERVQEDHSGPDLQDTNGDGIPDKVAEMDLSMPTGGPGVVGTPLDLDPIARHSDEDGIPDNQSVNISYRVYQEDGQTKLTAQVTNAIDHPSRTDTTGNGLSDDVQINGWDVQLVDNHDDAEELWEVIANRDDDRDPGQFFSERTVFANPLVTNSDGDELADAREKELGTDPERADTTGDAIRDHEALELDKEDPTMFTTTPPSAELTYYNRWSELPEADVDIDLGAVRDGNYGDAVDADVENFEWYFRYDYHIEDNAGVGSYELTREGNQLDSGYGSGDEDVYDSVTHESLIEGSLSALRGSQSRISADDIHGNSDTVLVQSEQSFYGKVLTDLGEPTWAGILSGFTHSGAGLPELLVSIGSDPGAAKDGFVDFLSEVNGTVLQRMVRHIDDSVAYEMRADNPHADLRDGCGGDLEISDYLYIMGSHSITQGLGDLPVGSDCQKYAAGFYTGYVTHFAASMVYGGTLTKSVSRATTVSRRLSSVSNRVGSSLSRVGFRGGTRATRTVSKVMRASHATELRRITNRIDDMSTAGQMARVRYAAEGLSSARRSTLSGDGLGNFLLKHGQRGGAVLDAASVTATARFIMNADPAAVNRVLTGVDDTSRRTAILSRLQRVDEGARYAFVDFTLKHGDVAVDDVIRFANTHGTDGMALLSRVDDASDVTRLLSASDDTMDDLVSLYRSDPAAARKVVDFATKSDELRYIRISDDAPLRPLVEHAEQGLLRGADGVVQRGGRIIWYQRIGSIGDVADEGVDAFLVLDALVLGDQVSPGTIKAQLDELDADDVEGSAIEITYDQDTGEVIDVQVVE